MRAIWSYNYKNGGMRWRWKQPNFEDVTKIMEFYMTKIRAHIEIVFSIEKTFWGTNGKLWGPINFKNKGYKNLD